MSEQESAKDKTVWVHCNRCLDKTKHLVIAEHSKTYAGWDNRDDGMWATTTYTIFVCCGCESLAVRDVFAWSEEDYPTVEFYPPPISRRLPVWINQLPADMGDLLKETYTALHSNSSCLALMGARALVDLFIIAKVGDVGNFQQKLQALQNNGYLSSKHREILEVALEAGNAAAHRGFKPKAETLNQVIDIVEHLLQLYPLEETSPTIKKVIPQRTKPIKASP